MACLVCSKTSMKPCGNLARGEILRHPQRSENAPRSGAKKSGLQAEEIVARKFLQAPSADRALSGPAGAQHDGLGLELQIGELEPVKHRVPHEEMRLHWTIVVGILTVCREVQARVSFQDAIA